MELLNQIILFFSQTLIIVLAIVTVIIVIAATAAKGKKSTELEIENINQKHEDEALMLKQALLSEEEFKAEKKAYKEKVKAKLKAPAKSDAPQKPKAFVINFLDGDIKASRVTQFREEITAVLLIAQPQDEIIINVESPGGAVHGYGLAAAQIHRLKSAGFKVTVCVDKVAASGGYLMACIADKIVSAPFAIIGSIGVVAQVPNFHKLLKKNDIEYKEYTAGDYKRTISIFGEITDKGEQKFNEQLESTHVLFKNFVHKFRPGLDLSKVATGEYWFGEDALKLGLVDELGTSDDFILAKTQTHTVIKLTVDKKPKLSDKIAEFVSLAISKATEKVLSSSVSTLEKTHLQKTNHFDL